MGVSVFAGVGQQALAATGLMPAFIRAPRSIGTIIPDVTIEEHFSDRATVTMHPLAHGTVIFGSYVPAAQNSDDAMRLVKF